MSKKADLDILGESHIPADLLTNSLGSSYGLDTYPDMGVGMGTLEGILDPDFTEAPALPTGLSRNGAGEGMDLTTLVEDSLADLAWLDPTQLQDLDRLPRSSVDTMIPELVEAWGVNRRTNGIEVISQDLTQARYEESLGEVEPKRKATAQQIRNVVRQAMRRSAAGQNIDTVIREAMDSMGEEMHRIAPFLRVVQAEHGLAGKVFVRASAYPSYGGGKWSKIVKRQASGARYIIVSADELEQATWIKNGRCQYTSKFAVTEVPWKTAFNHYAPRFEARVASRIPTFEGSHKERLRQAFLFVPGKEAKEGHFQQHDPVARETYRAPQENLRDPVKVQAAREDAAARGKINKLAANGLLEIPDRDRILDSKAPSHVKLRVAAGLASLPKVGKFSGSVNQAHAVNRVLYLDRLAESAKRSHKRHAEVSRVGEERAQAAVRNMAARGQISEEDCERLLLSSGAYHEMLRGAAQLALISRADYDGVGQKVAEKEVEKTWNRLDKVNVRIRAAQKTLDARAANYPKEGQDGVNQRGQQRRETRIRKGVRRIQNAISKGAQGPDLRKLIKRTFIAGDERAGIKALAPLLRKTGALHVTSAVEYEGTQFTQHVAEKTSSESRIAGQVRSSMKWIRRSMSEGFAGKDLSDLIDRRFSAKVLAEASEEIRSLRADHEGGAGFIYVDSAAYASTTGVKGCEEGALRHRANQIPAVSTLDRCSSCTLARTLEDGTRKCSVYNKLLLENPTDTELRPLKEANVRVANMDDAEQTQAMFMTPENAYHPGEYGLKNSNLDDIEANLPEHGKVADITFGGWNF